MSASRCCRRRPIRDAAGLVAAVVSTGVFAAAASGGPATIARFGAYTFAKLGYGNQTLTGPALVRGIDVHFRLPAGARERPGHWYLLRLHVIAELTPKADGTAYVEAASASYGTAQITFKTAGGRRTWAAVGLLNGTEVHPITGERVDLRFANFMPFPSIHPGNNTLHISVDQYGDVLRSLRVVDDSALEYTRQGPADLRVSAVLDHRVGRTSRAVVATVTVRNVGGRTARQIVVTAIAGTPGFRFEGSRRRSHAKLRPHETWIESFVLRLLRPGAQRVFFLAGSSANRPGAELNFRAVGPPVAQPSAASRQPPPSNNNNNGLWIAVAVGGPAAAAVLVVAARRRR